MTKHDKIQLQNKLHQSLDSEVIELKCLFFLVFVEIRINFSIHLSLISKGRPYMTSPMFLDFFLLKNNKSAQNP